MTAIAELQKQFRKINAAGGLALPDRLTNLIHVSIAEQSLTFYHNRLLAAVYPVSTAANGVGCQEGSGCTPHGWHIVKSRIGGCEPVATIFRGRIVSGVALSLIHI